MSIKSLKTGTRNVSGLSGNVPEHHVLIQEQTFSGSTSSITFVSIPQDYTHLNIRFLIQNTSASNGGQGGFISFNGDTTFSNYRSHSLYGSGTAASSFTVQSAGWNGVYYGTTTGTTVSAARAAIDGWILDYTNTSKNKVARFLNGWDTNGAGEVLFSSGMWINTSAITSLSISVNSFNVGSGIFSLYGVK